MESKTEIQVAKEWISTKSGLALEELFQKHIVEIELMGGDERTIYLFRKEVLDTFMTENHPALFIYPEEMAFELYRKEVLTNQMSDEYPCKICNDFDFACDCIPETDVNDTEEVKRPLVNIAAEKYQLNYFHKSGHPEIIQIAFKDGAEWQKSQQLDLIGKLKEPEFNLLNYNQIEDSDLRQISDVYDKIKGLIMRTDSVHEDIIEFMIKPFSDILQHHGINLDEQNF